ncbi:hypothetical protein T3H00_26925 [Pseudomonas fluorescens]|uniref:hypothetical protein n=1 Tax=Pseudomonas fluorescens TaxID=294 RepID=UPI002ACA8FA8|nr:hypothetical protein [Pseudomonas fluorescens]MDZ5436287.1 hypothetical protein [Pseudomonas fluorescens]
MTIEIVIASDVTEENAVINTSCARDKRAGRLSAASFLVPRESNGPLNVVLDFIFTLLSKKFPEQDIWLFVGNSAVQPDTRIVRYRKLWGGLKSRGLEVIGGMDFREEIVSDGEGVKFFGATRLSDLSVESVVNIILSERCSYVVALPASFEFKKALELGWVGDLVEDLDYCYCVCEKNGLIFKNIGEFDDCQRGFVSIGSPQSIGHLLS